MSYFLSFLLRDKQNSAAPSIYAHSPIFAKQTYPSLPTQSQTFVSSKRGILHEVGDQSSVRWLLLGRSTLLSNLQHISSKASLIMTSPIKGISMYLTSLPFQHKDLPSFNMEHLRQCETDWTASRAKRADQERQYPQTKERALLTFSITCFRISITGKRFRSRYSLTQEYPSRFAKECLGVSDKRPGNFL